MRENCSVGCEQEGCSRQGKPEQRMTGCGGVAVFIVCRQHGHRVLCPANGAPSGEYLRQPEKYNTVARQHCGICPHTAPLHEPPGLFDGACQDEVCVCVCSHVCVCE